ncbi:MAG: aminomethyl-transferring glycine dehydrogenase subunit GcvPA [Planctomycetota bacterium]|jgi:glycine dehydrogenase subunit 1
MRYLSHTDAERRAMLDTIGAGSIDELFAPIPEELRFGRDLDIGPALTELEQQEMAEGYAAGTLSAADLLCFQGGGYYDHFIPAAIDQLVTRGEYLTAYTPYQPEAAQGTLQYLYEYQTMMCSLTGLPVSNASLYEGATGCAEAVLLAMSQKRKADRVVVSGALHPHSIDTVRTYVRHLGLELTVVPAKAGATDLDGLRAAVTDGTCAVMVGQPSWFGIVEDIPAIAEIAHGVKAQCVVQAEPIALNILEAPGNQGADMVLGEGQPLGSPMAFGGPTFGFFCCREDLVRKLPGRLVGETLDTTGKRAFVLTFQTREQHIRREKATSNICTSQSLYALRAAIYCSLLGPQGLREVAELSLTKAHTLARRLAAEAPGYELKFPDQPFVREFALRCPKPAAEVVAAGVEHGILAGIDCGQYDPALSDTLLVACTERRSAEDLDQYVAALNQIAEGGN